MTIRVLLVIDPNVGWEGLRLLIQHNPCMQLAAEASDIRSALELARRLQPDIVIMDINIPLPEIIRTAQDMIRCVPAGKVIILSMQTDRHYVEKSFLSGISGYLMKESTYEELIPAIQQVMTGRTYLSRDIRIDTREAVRPG